MLIEQLFDAGLGHASYLIADPDEGVAFLVDPDRNVNAYLERATALGVLITHSFETHVHNDYVSGSAALANARPITVVTGPAAQVTCPRVALADGATLDVGALRVQCVATPGHTPEHVSYLVADRRRTDDPQYLFSGGALLVGNIARVDLLGAEIEDELAHAAYASLRDRILPLPDHLAVFPTHGGGSACASSSIASSRWTTLGFERLHNDVARAATADFATFHRAVAHGLPVAPAYYPAVRALNSRGASAPTDAAVPVLRDPLPHGVALIDPRPPHIFAAGHRRGALNIVGNESFAVRVGAVIPFGTALVLLTLDRDAATRLRRQLATIGFDDVRGIAEPLPDTDEAVARSRTVDAPTAKELADAGSVLIDVREISEFDEGHAPGAKHIPYQQLDARMAELPDDRELVVYCASGVRSSLAASLLERSGRKVANVRGGLTAWVGAELPIER
ncbi:MAG TPA: MBL fold metallo-hydrolase [Candidatus Limnocylindrales bacterium]|nr:MBL fold metallo-hydrolase [Candidatus Limnocylindrales bacterium]